MIVGLLGTALVGSDLGSVADPAASAEPVEPARIPTVSLRDKIVAGEIGFNYLITKRRQAIRDGDLDAFLANLDPGNDELIANQTVLFENLTSLPIGTYDLANTSYTPPRPAAATDPRTHPWQATWTYVDSLVQLDEVDDLPTVATHRWDIEFRDGRLVITGIEPSRARDAYAPAPWESAPLAVARTDHMLVLATPDVADRAEEVADAAERAYDRSLRHWPEEGIRNEFVIFATANRELFAEWYGGLELISEHTTGWALPVPTCCSTKDGLLGDVTSSHIAIDLTEITDRIDLEWLLAHELTHAVAEPLGNAATTTQVTWADEGYAEFVGIMLLDSYDYIANWDEVARDFARGDDFDGTLPPDEDFYGENAQINYALSVRFFEFLVDRHGEADVSDFYFALNAMAIPDADAAFADHFGTSKDEVLDDWADWVRR